MPHEDIILLPPTHEQTVYTFHVPEPRADAFLHYLRAKGITPWRPVEIQPQPNPDASSVVQIEVDVTIGEEKLKAVIQDFNETHAEQVK